jgi:pyridoxal phosphate enzyme (YggS family)
MDRTGLGAVQRRVAEAARRAGRADEIALVVVTKYASDAAVTAVLEEGATLLGESRAQSLIPRAGAFPQAAWHFVGRLQRNKVAIVRPLVSMLHALDRIALADRWAGAEVPPVLVQVNIAGEPQKAGVVPDEAPALVEHCHQLGIEVHGLMAVPPRPDTPSDSARWFTALRELRDRLGRDHPGLRELSMGMSDDFEVAVAEGSTILRVGRAIFDPFDDED